MWCWVREIDDVACTRGPYCVVAVTLYFRKVAPVRLSAGAACFQNAMFGDFNLRRRDVKNLAGFRYMGLVQSAVAGIAGGWQRMDDHLIRFGDALQR